MLKPDAAAKDQTVTAPVAPPATTVDITPGAIHAPNDGDQTIGTVDVKITKSKNGPGQMGTVRNNCAGARRAIQHYSCWISLSRLFARWLMRWMQISRPAFRIPLVLLVRPAPLLSVLQVICRMRQMRARFSLTTVRRQLDLQMVLGFFGYRKPPR
ncbi:hypothetical protein LNP17_13750 [Klebsiella variicola subsp. variicola]|nr:hypothetical protein [Klebsiella variicola subsp. variicola]